MKTPAAVIFILGVSLIICGCGKDQYAIEKQYYWAHRAMQKVMNNPHATPSNELDRVVGQLRNFTLEYPNTNLAIEAEFDIARLYIVKEEFSRARDQLNRIIDARQKSPVIVSEAMHLIGNSFEIENNWEAALKEYKKLMENYPTTKRGLDAPVYIAQHYKAKFQPEKMMSAYSDAIDHYRLLSERYNNTAFSFKLEMLIADCYAAKNDWKGAATSLEGIIYRYLGKVDVDGLMLNAAMIYSQRLKDHVRAKQIIDTMMRDYPQSKYTSAANDFLKSLKEQ
jgi:TolA-binding protein